MNEFFGWNFSHGQATFQTNINGKCISLCGDNNCAGDSQLRRFTLAVFETEDRKKEITGQAITDQTQWIDDEGKEVCGTVENFITAVEWCKQH
jgi:hypothetical protein